MDQVNDLQLTESLLTLRNLSRRLQDLAANKNQRELWRALGEMNRHSQLAMYRLMDLGL